MLGAGEGLLHFSLEFKGYPQSQPSIFIEEEKERWLHILDNIHRQTLIAEAYRGVVDTKVVERAGLWFVRWASLMWSLGTPSGERERDYSVLHQTLKIRNLHLNLHTMVSREKLRSSRWQSPENSGLQAQHYFLHSVTNHFTSLVLGFLICALGRVIPSLPDSLGCYQDWTIWDHREGITL